MIPREKVTSQSFAPRERSFSLKQPRLLRLVGLKNFIWLPLLIALAIVLHFKGTPHVLFEYSYAGSTKRITDCTYIGLHSRTVAAKDGQCPVFMLLRGNG